MHVLCPSDSRLSVSVRELLGDGADDDPGRGRGNTGLLRPYIPRNNHLNFAAAPAMLFSQTSPLLHTPEVHINTRTIQIWIVGERASGRFLVALILQRQEKTKKTKKAKSSRNSHPTRHRFSFLCKNTKQRKVICSRLESNGVLSYPRVLLPTCLVFLPLS